MSRSQHQESDERTARELASGDSEGDFADEHDKPTFADEHENMGRDESTPDGLAGMDPS